MLNFNRKRDKTTDKQGITARESINLLNSIKTIYTMKRRIPYLILSALVLGATVFYFSESESKNLRTTSDKTVKKKKKTEEERRLFVNERIEYELSLQRNPITGEIPLEEKQEEFENAVIAKQKALAARTSSTYVPRGPSNLGGRTRDVRVDLSDNTSNTMLAGGVSSGLFRTTDGGSSWTKVSPNDEIHNVTAIAQDPRPGFQNIWYYATGEGLGNSANLGAFNVFGQGVWRSTDNGLTWTKIAQTDSTLESFDSRLDFISAIEVSPTNGDLFIASLNRIYRFDGTTLTTELDQSGANTSLLTDVVINSSGRVFAGFHGSQGQNGVWTSPTGNGSWTRIAQNGSPTGWSSVGRIVLATAPSNDDILYALFRNGQVNTNGQVEADLWHYNLATDTWTDYTSKLPDEPGGNLSGNDPFSIQGGYDLVVSVKPDDENFVLIGGTNAYRITDITTGSTFERIGGYGDNQSYALYSQGGVSHHPDIHALVFDPHNANMLISGTDGGVHRTNILNGVIEWTNLNNNYQTYQYYHVALDPQSGGDVVFGGAQDNGTTIGGTDAGLPNSTEMNTFFGGDGVAVGIARRNGGNDLQLYYGSQNGNIRTNFPSFRGIQPAGSSSQFVTYFYLDPDNTNALYYAGLTTLYKTNDAENVQSNTWDNLGALAAGENIVELATTRGAYNPASSYLLIGGQDGGIYRVNDPQNVSDLSSAVNITPIEIVVSGSNTYVSSLAIHPTNPDIVLATYSNYGITNIFLTTNATSNSPSWTVVERNLSAHSIRSAAVTEVAGEIIYFVGTGRGLYSSTDPTTEDWDLEGPNDIGFALVSELVYRPSDNRLLVGTHGNGMYETTVENTLSANDFTKGELGVTMYPNPAQVELNFIGEIFDTADDIEYVISDLTGKVVKKGTVIDRKIEVNTMRPGIYLASLKANGKQQTIKFIKN